MKLPPFARLAAKYKTGELRIYFGSNHQSWEVARLRQRCMCGNPRLRDEIGHSPALTVVLELPETLRSKRSDRAGLHRR